MSKRLELVVSPLTGRKHPSQSSKVQLVDVEKDSNRALEGALRGCCYNALTKTLLICDTIQCCVLTFDMEIQNDTTISIRPRGQIGARGNGTGKFMCPVAIDVNTRGEIAVADQKLNRVTFFTGSGHTLHHFGKTGSSRGEFRGLVDLRFTVLGHIAVVDSDNHRVQVMTATGGLVLVIGRQGWRRGEFMNPCAIDINRNGDMFVCDGDNKRIQRFNAKGKFLAVWGSRRVQRGPSTPQYDANGFPITTPVLCSVFETPCDVLIGLNGEILVCDRGRREIIVFNDTGKCLHTLSIPDLSQWSPITFCVCRDSLLVLTRAEIPAVSLPPTGNQQGEQVSEESCEHELVIYPPPTPVQCGKLETWAWSTLLNMVSFLTYADAIQTRLVNHCCHRACRVLRNEWKLYPLTPGCTTIIRYNSIARPASGRLAVVEAFEKWGLRIFKPANRIRKHVMDFESGFRCAVSSLFGPMFFYQHEDILRAMFGFHAERDKHEIDQAAFVEIVTKIEEVRAGFLSWTQCCELRGCKEIPKVKTTTSEHHKISNLSSPSLRLVEDAQQHQLTRLLSKLKSL